MTFRFAVCLIAVEFGVAGCVMTASPKTVPAYIASAIAAPDRPQTDVDRDAFRKPAQLMAFAEVRPNSQIADIMPGGGYVTRLFSHAVGTRGHVYAVVPSELAQFQAKAAEDAEALAAGFQFEASSAVLSNAHDPHNDPVFAAAIRGHTDRLVYEFRKRKGGLAAPPCSMCTASTFYGKHCLNERARA